MKMLKQSGSLHLYVYTPSLALRADMTAVDMTHEEITAYNKNLDTLRAQEGAKAAAKKAKRDAPETAPTIPIAAESKIVSIGTMDKAQLRALAAEKNINIKNMRDVEAIRERIKSVLLPGEPPKAPPVLPVEIEDDPDPVKTAEEGEAGL